MIYTQKGTIEELVFEALKTGPQVIVTLIDRIKKVRPATTKQGVYAALRVLKQKNCVVTYGKKASLNTSWLKEMNDYFSLAEFHYTTKDNRKNDFLNLQEGERIQYNFKDPITTDTFWGHVQNILVEVAPVGSSVISYDPYYWPLLIRPIEKGLIDFILSKNIAFLMVNGGRTAMDKAVQKEFNGTTSQYEMLEKPMFPKKNYYVSLIGDFIIEVWINPVVAEEIDRIYTLNVVTDELKNEIEMLVSKKANTRFVISKNKRKSDILRKKMSKYFV